MNYFSPTKIRIIQSLSTQLGAKTRAELGLAQGAATSDTQLEKLPTADTKLKILRFVLF